MDLTMPFAELGITVTIDQFLHPRLPHAAARMVARFRRAYCH
jgi:hypothetical protein